MKHITILGKTNIPVFEVQNEKYRKVCVFPVSLTTAVHQILLSVPLDTNQSIIVCSETLL